MKKYKIIVKLVNGDELRARSLGKDQEEALATLMRDERFLEFVGVGEDVEISIVSVDILPEGENKEVEDNGRFVLQPCEEPGWWIVTGMETMVCIRFKEKDFEHTHKITSIEEERCDALDTATSLRMLSEYLHRFHKELL